MQTNPINSIYSNSEKSPLSIIKALDECCLPAVGIQGFDTKEFEDGSVAFINREKNLIWSEDPIDVPGKNLSKINLSNPTYWYVDQDDNENIKKITSASFGSPYAVYEMVLPLKGYVLPEENPQIKISIAKDAAEVGLWCRIASGDNLSGYQLLLDFAIALYRANPQKYLFYLGFCGGKPVSTAMIMLGTNMAGLFFVSTLNHFRKKGIAYEVSTYAIRKAISLNYEFIILSSTQMAKNLYKKLGFEIKRTFLEYFLQ